MQLKKIFDNKLIANFGTIFIKIIINQLYKII